MAISVSAAVWNGFNGGGSELLVMLALADRADDSGLCWPSIGDISTMTRLSDKQARRVVHALIDAGHVSLVANAQGGAKSRRYRINIDRLTPPADGSRTINEPSITVRNKSGRKTLIPEQFGVSGRVQRWAMERGFDHLELRLEDFIGKARAKGYTYADWDEAFMTAIRNDWAGLNQPKGSSLRNRGRIQPTQSAHSGFDAIDYHEGIGPDGRF